MLQKIKTHLYSPAIFLVSALCAVIAGYLASLGSLFIVYAVVGLVISVFLVTRPYVMLMSMTLTCLLITGVLVYSFGIGRAEWLPYIFAAGCWFAVLLYKATERTRLISNSVGLPAFFFILILFYLVGILGGILNEATFSQYIIGVKNYVVFLGIPLLYWFFPLTLAQFKKVVYLSVGIGLLQILFTSYQYVFVRSERLTLHGASGGHIIGVSDSVVGTFGGNPLSGGLTSILALFLVIQCTVVLSLFLKGHLSKSKLLLILPWLLLPLMLAEAKVMFVYVPVVALMLLWHLYGKRPIIFMSQVMGVLLFLMTALMAYQYLHWSVAEKGVTESVTNAFSYSFVADSDRAMDRGALTRMGAIVYWWDGNKNKPVHMAFGYGLGASKSTSTVVETDLVRQHGGLALDQTGLSSLLWDSGIIGTLLFFTALFSAYGYAARIYKLSSDNSFESAMALGLKGMVLLLVISLPYSHTTLQSSAGLYLLFFTLGSIAYLWNNLGRSMKTGSTQVVG